jgi:hypothetical protein
LLGGDQLHVPTIRSRTPIRFAPVSQSTSPQNGCELADGIVPKVKLSRAETAEASTNATSAVRQKAITPAVQTRQADVTHPDE